MAALKNALKPNVDVATRRRLIFGSTLGAAALLVLALVGILNYLSFRHYRRWDWTKSHLYTLSEKSQSIVKGLAKDVDVIVFMDDQSPSFQPTRELLERYAAASPKIHVSVVDPVRNPARAQQLVQKYQVQRAAVVFESGKEKRIVDAADLADYDYSAMQEGGRPQMKGFKGEQKFTSAIVDLVEAKKPSILFTTGHGEPSLDDFEGRGFGRLQQFLGTDNFKIEEWASLGKAALPPDTDLVVVAGPTQPFVQPELDLLSRFLQNGGRVLVLIDPNLNQTGRVGDTGLAAWLGGWGVKAQDDVVVDPSNPLPFFGAETIFASNYGTHGITDALRQARVPVVFSLARSVTAGTAPKDAVLTELVKTSADGWGETDLAHLTQVEKGPQDLAGPVSLGIALELNAATPAPPPGDEDMPAPPPSPPPAGPKGRMVVFGDSDFATNAQLDQPGNATLIANTLNWMVQRETHLGIAPKEPDQVHLSLTPQERRLDFWLVVFGLPAIALIAGIVVTVKRRR
ncbi:MAG TPA: GldG family protein [Thermoanaerobaculia bacterium]|nr:GldG family protein [Thermoanaerobaculia bacterium]